MIKTSQRGFPMEYNQTVNWCMWQKKDWSCEGNWQECCQFKQGHKGKHSFDVV